MKNVSTNKKTDADQAIKKTKVIGKPVDKHDFWFYAEGVEDEEGNPIVFNANDDYEATPMKSDGPLNATSTTTATSSTTTNTTKKPSSTTTNIIAA